jgi:hypothetical protein
MVPLGSVPALNGQIWRGARQSELLEQIIEINGFGLWYASPPMPR